MLPTTLTQAHIDEDEDMLDADILADFDCESGSEKEFLEQLGAALPEDVSMHLASPRIPVAQAVTTSIVNKQPSEGKANKMDSAETQQNRVQFVAQFAKERADETLKGPLMNEMLQDFKEEIYTYGFGLGLGEPQALLEASKAETALLTARESATANERSKVPQMGALEISEATMKVQNTVGDLLKKIPGEKIASQRESAVPTPQKRKIDTTEAAQDSAKRHKKASQEAVPVVPKPAAGSSTEEAPKLTRKQKQELYRQQLANKKPVIAKPAVPVQSKASTPAATPGVAPIVATKPSSVSTAQSKSPNNAESSSEAAQATVAQVLKKRQRVRKGASQKTIENNAANGNAAPNPAAPADSATIKANTPVQAPSAQSASSVAADAFIDMRAPKKKKRARKSKGGNPTTDVASPSQAVETIKQASQVGSDAGKAAVNEIAKPAVAIAAAKVVGDLGKDNKNKAKRREKMNKKKSGPTESAPQIEVPAQGSEAHPTAASHPIVSAESPAAPKVTPIPAPGSTIKSNTTPSLAAKAVKDVAQTPVPVANLRLPNTATDGKRPESVSRQTPILPSSSVSKLALSKSPAVTAAKSPAILPSNATPASTASTSAPLSGIQASNSERQSRKRGPRKSVVVAKAVLSPTPTSTRKFTGPTTTGSKQQK